MNRRKSALARRKLERLEPDAPAAERPDTLPEPARRPWWIVDAYVRGGRALQLVLGTVADKVIRRASMPTLVPRPAAVANGVTGPSGIAASVSAEPAAGSVV